MTTLGDACSQGGGFVQTGPFGSQLHASDYRPVGIPSIMPVNIGDNRVIEDGIKRVSEKDAERLGRHRVKPGDIIFSRRGDVERRALIRETEEGWLCGTGCLLVRLGENGLDSVFTSYYLAHPDVRSWIVRHAVGSTMPNLNTKILSSVPVAVPPPHEQRAITRVLSSLDDKIELNREMNRTLEATAQAIFRSWFVDFDPVVAKADGRKPFGMSDDLAALFPDRFVESEMGPIPEGWEIRSVADIAEYVNGRNFTKGASGTGRMVIRIAELNSGPSGSTVYNDVETKDRHTAYPDDILFAWSGSLDIYRWHRDEAIVNQHIFKVICNENPKWFVYFQLREAMPFFQAIASGKATTMGHIKRSHLDEAKLAMPPAVLLQEAGSTISPLYELVHRNASESHTLAALRDLLLPKLLSGEVRLNTADEAQATAAAG